MQRRRGRPTGRKSMPELSSCKRRRPKPTDLAATSTTTRRFCRQASRFPMIRFSLRGRRPTPSRSISERRNLRTIHALRHTREIGDDGLWRFVFASAKGTALADGDHGGRYALHRRDDGFHAQAALSCLDRNPQTAWYSNSCPGLTASRYTLVARRSSVAGRSIVNAGSRSQTLARCALCAAHRDAANRLGYAFRGRLSDRAFWLGPPAANPSPGGSGIRGVTNGAHLSRISVFCNNPGAHRCRVVSRLDPPGRGVSSHDMGDAFEADMTCYTSSNTFDVLV